MFWLSRDASQHRALQPFFNLLTGYLNCRLERDENQIHDLLGREAHKPAHVIRHQAEPNLL